MTNPPENTTGTRVYKKSSLNGKVTMYIGQRDYNDKFGKVDPIEGVVHVDREYMKDKKVFIHVLASFRYGREDLDVLGLTFRKDLYLDYIQLYPNVSTEKEEGEESSSVIKEASNQGVHQNKSNLTKLQSRLIQKLGESAFPFRFELPHNSPASVTLQPAPEDLGKPCGVDYELKAYISSGTDEKSNKRSTVKLAIRKLVFTSIGSEKEAPSTKIERPFKLTHGSIVLAARLNKARYNHGETISIYVTVQNQSPKEVKKISVQILQVADIMLFTRAMYKCVVDEVNQLKPMKGQHNWNETFVLCPLLSKNRQKRGLALDGKLRHEDTNLASSTITSEKDNIDDLGIVVSYKARIRLKFGITTKKLQVELPFTLTHPEPIIEESNSPQGQNEEPIICQDAHNDWLIQEKTHFLLDLSKLERPFNSIQ